MIAACRELLKRNLPPRAFQYARSCWWHGRFYVPHLAASLLVRRNPRVQIFPSGHASELVHELRSINVFAPTEMCRVMTRYGSDKGQGWHNYTTVYSVLFGKLRDLPLRIFELGLGTDNPEIASSMKANGDPGASLRGWCELFPHALVYGADIDRDILFEEDRIKTFYCDQLDGAAINNLWLQPGLQDTFDIIIDDGLHTFEANTSFLEGSLEHLRLGGIFVIEDILSETIERWRECLETIYSKRFPDHEFALMQLPNSSNDYDNNLLVIRRHA
jgi:SAM-dependent methyltransferase